MSRLAPCRTLPQAPTQPHGVQEHLVIFSPFCENQKGAEAESPPRARPGGGDPEVVLSWTTAHKATWSERNHLCYIDNDGCEASRSGASRDRKVDSVGTRRVPCVIDGEPVGVVRIEARSKRTELPLRPDVGGSWCCGHVGLEIVSQRGRSCSFGRNYGGGTVTGCWSSRRTLLLL